MIPEDKFGKQIYTNVFTKMQAIGRILTTSGYIESTGKPNLFFRKHDTKVFFCDLRGTEEVRIWEDTRPLFYWKLDEGIPKWARRRQIKNELMRLSFAGCNCRLSFYFSRNSEFDDCSTQIDEERGVYEWDDGFCLNCNKDFQNDGSFCSQECEFEYLAQFDDPLPKCQVCNLEIFSGSAVEHHTSYFPEKTIVVHRSCHNRIHMTERYPHLKPPKEDIDRHYGRNKS